jgi:outer membrane protein, heavy metal efflux system
MMKLITLWGYFVLFTTVLPCPPALAQDEPNPTRGAGAVKATPLSDLVEEALDRSPEIRTRSALVDAQRARIPQAGALPDPVISYGVLNEGRPVPFETLGSRDFSEAYIGITQDIPYAGKRALRSEVAREAASAEEWAYEGIRRRVAAEVATTYYDLYVISAALDIVSRNSVLLEQFSGVARARLSVGQTSQHDVLDVEVERSHLEERGLSLRGQQARLQSRLAALLGRSAPAAWVQPAPVSATAFDVPLESLLRQADDSSPRLREMRQRVAQAERAHDLARRERLPDLGAGFVYHDRGSLDPYYSFMGTLTLPLYAGRKQKQAVVEAAAGTVSSRAALDAARVEVQSAVVEAYQAVTTTAGILRLYEQGIIKQSQLALDSALAQYQVGKVDFETLLMSWRRLLDNELSYHEQLAEHEKALARLAVNVGTSPGDDSRKGAGK